MIMLEDIIVMYVGLETRSRFAQNGPGPFANSRNMGATTQRPNKLTHSFSVACACGG